MLRYAPRGGQPQWPRPDDMPEILWQLLGARGVESAQQAQAFLNPGPDQLLDPFGLQGMEAAVQRVRQAAQTGEAVWVWGDYDVDGVCATAILLRALEALGLSPHPYLPSRHQEGYGLNQQGLRQAAQEGCRLLITVDCGITAVELVQLAGELGMEVVVTDHHRPGPQLPHCILVNPLLGDYPNPGLCGAGVALKLAMALCPQEAGQLLDLAALATVADVVPLAGENRAIVSLGLAQMNRDPRPGIQALAQQAGLTGPIRAGHLGFQLGPRLNAGGRVSSARQALELLRCPSLDEALPLAQALDQCNRERQALEQQILQDAQAQLEQTDLSQAWAIVLAGEDWNVGVVGLAASRLVERYHLPTVLLASKGDELTGSCRSIPGVDIFQALSACAPLLTRFGGHRQAAGLSLLPANLAPFRQALQAHIRSACDPQVLIPLAEYDGEVTLDQVDRELVEMLDRLQPFGFGNPSPVLRCRGTVVQARQVGREGAHLSFTLAQAETALGGIFFSQGHRAQELEGAQCDLLFSPSLNSYMGRVRVQLETKAARLAQPDQRLRLSPDKWALLLHDFLTQALYNEAFPAENGWDMEDLAQALSASPRGQLILCAGAEQAAALWRQLAARGLAPEVWVGTYPQDRRCWNALCLLPQGQIPQGYRGIWCLGAPGWLLAPGRVARSAGPAAPWLAELPRVEALRRLYQAARRALAAPLSGLSALAFCRSLGQEAGLSPAGCLAGLLVLRDMDLVSWQVRPFQAAMRPLRKADPGQSPLFQRITLLRGWEVDDGETAPTAL